MVPQAIHVEAKGFFIFNVFFLEGSSSTLAVLATIHNYDSTVPQQVSGRYCTVDEYVSGQYSCNYFLSVSQSQSILPTKCS